MVTRQEQANPDLDLPRIVTEVQFQQMFKDIQDSRYFDYGSTMKSGKMILLEIVVFGI